MRQNGKHDLNCGSFRPMEQTPSNAMKTFFAVPHPELLKTLAKFEPMKMMASAGM